MRFTSFMIMVCTMAMVCIMAPGLALAQPEAEPADIAGIEACIAKEQKASERGFRCIDVISKACIDAPGGDTTLGMKLCTSRSVAAWDAILNREYQKARSALSPRMAGLLRDAQRAWITFRDKTCAVDEAFFEGGTLAGVVYLSCYEQETAIRALDLIWIAREAAL